MSLFIQYFIFRAEDLDHIMFRMGMLAVLRSRVMSSAIGVMITASHNPEPDNGVKLVDPHGEMLERDWEVIATELANVDDNQVEENIKRIIEQFKIDMDKNATVFIGRDTRFVKLHCSCYQLLLLSAVLTLLWLILNMSVSKVSFLGIFLFIFNFPKQLFSD